MSQERKTLILILLFLFALFLVVIRLNRSTFRACNQQGCFTGNFVKEAGEDCVFIYDEKPIGTIVCDLTSVTRNK